MKTRRSGIRAGIALARTLTLTVALQLLSPVGILGAQDPPKASEPPPPQFAETQQIQQNLLRSLLREKTTRHDPRDPGHARKTYVFSKKALHKAFGTTLAFDEYGFTYSSPGGSRRIFLVGGTQWEVSQTSSKLLLSARDFFKDAKDPGMADGGYSPVFVVFPEGVCCQFDLQPFGMFLEPYNEKEFLGRIGRIRLGSKWRHVPITEFWLHLPGPPPKCIRISPSGKLKELDGIYGRLEHSGYRFSEASDGKSFTVQFPYDLPEDKERYSPIRVHKLSDNGKPAFWVLKGDDFLYLEPPNDQGYCTIKKFSFYNKGQWYEPLPPIKADVPFWPIGEYYWTMQDGYLRGLGGWNVNPIAPLRVERPNLRLIETGTSSSSSSIEWDLFFLPPSLISFDDGGFAVIKWPKPHATDVKKKAGSPSPDPTPPTILNLIPSIEFGAWDLRALFGDDFPDFVCFSVEKKTLIAHGIVKDYLGSPVLGELRVPLSGGNPKMVTRPIPGLAPRSKLLGEREGWFVFLVPGNEQHLLCLCRKNGYIRSIVLPMDGPIDPHQVEIIWGQEDLWPEATDVRYWDVTRGN